VETLAGGGHVIRVVLTGSESTGKTVLAWRLAQHYRAEHVPEFVRGYAEKKNGVLSFSDHGPIAYGQIALEDKHFARAERLIIQDTDLLSTVVYCAHYFGQCPAWIADAAAERRPDLYLLCDIDIPWIADGVRDRGHMREPMQKLFVDAVVASGVPFALVTGVGDVRFERAVEAIDALLLASD
jgi:HTH-type transcriptional repressor of NAD biosynthesis genes